MTRNVDFEQKWDNYINDDSSSETTILVIYYSLWGHLRIMANNVAKGIEMAGCKVKIFQVPETLPPNVIDKMQGVPQSKYASQHPILTRTLMKKEMPKAQGYMFGMPSRFGTMPAQVKSLFDGMGEFWKTGALIGKCAGIFFGSATQGGGQETVALTTIANLSHLGIVFIPMGYSTNLLSNMDEIHGGSPYGCGTLSKNDGSRMPSELEKNMAIHHGKHTASFIKRIKINTNNNIHSYKYIRNDSMSDFKIKSDRIEPVKSNNKRG